MTNDTVNCNAFLPKYFGSHSLFVIIIMQALRISQNIKCNELNLANSEQEPTFLGCLQKVTKSNFCS